MDIAVAINAASLVTGLTSAICWVAAAVVKAPPPKGLEGQPDGAYWGGIVSNGGELLGTLKRQAKWNSAAAFTASATVLLQIGVNLISG